MAIDLNTHVYLFAEDGAVDFSAPVWIGSLNQFWKDNQDEYPTYGTLADIRVGLGFRGAERIGGGAGANFLLCTAEYVAEKLAIKRNLAGKTANLKQLAPAEPVTPVSDAEDRRRGALLNSAYKPEPLDDPMDDFNSVSSRHHY